MLINVKMPTIVGILTFMIVVNFMLSSVEYEKSFITSSLVFKRSSTFPRYTSVCWFCQVLFYFSKNVSDLGDYHLSATEDNWSLILESPSNIVSNVSFDSSTFTLELSGTTLV